MGPPYLQMPNQQMWWAAVFNLCIADEDTGSECKAIPKGYTNNKTNKTLTYLI